MHFSGLVTVVLSSVRDANQGSTVKQYLLTGLIPDC